jgi:hypothetical protein
MLLTNGLCGPLYMQKDINRAFERGNEMKNHNRGNARDFGARIFCAWVLCGAMAAGMGAGAVAQTHPAAKQLPAAAAPAPSDQDVADTQEQLLKLLRMSPTLTTVVAHDPSLLSDQQYVQRNNPELAQFLAAHPDVAQNPDFYLFSQLDPHGGRRDQALERAVWPEFSGPQREGSSAVQIMDRMAPVLGFACFFIALVWIIRLFVESRRWSRAFQLQSEVHGRLIDKFSTNQELAAYMETEAGKRFLEGAPVQIGMETGQRMPNAVARVLTPLQIGIVLALLGAGLLALRHAGPDTYEPMLVMGMIVLMPGVGFILSAGVTWVLARRLGMLPEPPSDGSTGARERL